jgi:putative two-component system response regulator
MNMARTIALTHHERWDGGGYPHGIGGTEIPFVGRVTAVCDVFDALISERPYKKPWPRRKALAELDRGAGKQFDPDLVKGFKELLPEVDRIMKRYREPTRRSKPIPSV